MLVQCKMGMGVARYIAKGHNGSKVNWRDLQLLTNVTDQLIFSDMEGECYFVPDYSSTLMKTQLYFCYRLWGRANVTHLSTHQ